MAWDSCWPPAGPLGLPTALLRQEPRRRPACGQPWHWQSGWSNRTRRRRGQRGVDRALCILGDSTFYWFLGTVMMARGLGVGLSPMPTMTAAYRAIQPHQIADATPQLNLLQRLGGAVGTTVFTIVLTRHLQQAGLSSHGRAAAFGDTFFGVIVATAIATAPALLLLRSERSRTATAP